MTLLLFLGSGISYKSALPNVNDITNSIFKEKWHKHTAQVFYYGQHPNPYFRKEDISPVLQEFLHIIKEFSDKYIIERRGLESTYEDLFYICQQISDNERIEIDNPVVQPFIHYITEKSKHLFTTYSSGEIVNLSSLASNSLTFINCVVHHALYSEKDPVGLDLIYELSKLYSKIDIATLNHDLLIERELEKDNIFYIDGFGENKGDVRWFEPSVYNDTSRQVSLFKLHGSINWYSFREEVKINDQYHTTDKYGLALNPDNNHCKNENGTYLTSLNYTPIFLTGTYNKLSAYNFGIIKTIHNKFEEKLWNHKIMIMSGYGWNDRGINGRLFEWLFSSVDKRLFLLHENPEEKIKMNSKSAMWHRYDDLVHDGRLIPIKKWLSDIQIDELIQIIEGET